MILFGKQDSREIVCCARLYILVDILSKCGRISSSPWKLDSVTVELKTSWKLQAYCSFKLQGSERFSQRKTSLLTLQLDTNDPCNTVIKKSAECINEH